MEMREMCKERTPYKCAECGGELLFFVTDRHNLIDYKRFYKEHGATSISLKRALYKYNIQYLKCMQCNKLYVIDWTTGYPTQVTNLDNLNKFRRKGD